MRVTSPLRSRTGYTALTFVTSIAATAWFAYRKGQDASWDQLNYHLSLPFLLLHGTFWGSIAPSGIQTFLNPFVLVPEYLLIRAVPAPIAVAVIAIVQALAFVIAGRICLRIAPPDPVTRDHRPAFLGFLLCLLSPMALSEAGTTIVDLLLAIPILLAFLLLLTRGDGGAGPKTVIAGLLLGAATGLKLTNGIFAIGALGFYAVGTRSIRHRIGAIALFAIAGALGFLVAAGYWHLALWERFGNPVFPFANNIFHSPDAPDSPLRDTRFLPTSVWDIVGYPLYWLLGGSPHPGLLSPASETDPKDARFVLALALAPVALIVGVLRRRRPPDQGVAGMLLACAISYVVWLFGFGIQRYLIPVEILCGAVVLALVSWIDTARLRLGMMLGLAVITLARIHVASWGRVPWGHHPWESRWRTIAETPLALPGQPLIFLTGQPTAFLALSLPGNARYVGFDTVVDPLANEHTVLSRQLRAALDATPPPTLYAVLAGPLPTDAQALVGSYGLHVTSDCRDLLAAAKAYRVCDVAR
jgi:hypothetical protein